MMGEKDAEIEFRTGSKAGPVIATLKTGNGKEWDISKGNLVKKITGVHHIFITAKNNKRIEVDWVSFE